MTTDKRNKTLYWIFKVASIIVSCFFPVWAICAKFPLWKEGYGAGRSVGTGLILIMIVFVIIFRKTVFKFLEEKFKLKHAPPIVVWIIMLIASYILLLISNFVRDLIVVLWMGLLGCALGAVITFIGENFFVDNEGKEVKEDKENKEETNERPREDAN
jgi:predicted ferric reductase